MISLDKLKKEYEGLINLPPDANVASKRSRGYAFERLLNKIFAHDNLDPRSGYKPDGEQIDGSIYLDGRVYLIEAKWHADPLPASTLYQFKGKVDGKLAGTIGIFISMSGYARDAVDALTLGKDLNVILLDRSDIDAAIFRGIGVRKMLKLKLRGAAEEGAIYFPVEGTLITAKKARKIDIDDLRYDHVNGNIVATRPLETSTADLLVVCEGDSDRVIISVLIERILANAASTRSIKILTAMGKMAIPRVANALWSTSHSEAKVLIVTDSDNDPVGTAAMLSNGLSFPEWVAAIPNPSIETWLDIDLNTIRRQGRQHRIERLRLAAQRLNIDALIKQDDQFAKFYEAVLTHDRYGQFQSHSR